MSSAVLLCAVCVCFFFRERTKEKKIDKNIFPKKSVSKIKKKKNKQHKKIETEEEDTITTTTTTTTVEDREEEEDHVLLFFSTLRFSLTFDQTQRWRATWHHSPSAPAHAQQTRGARWIGIPARPLP